MVMIVVRRHRRVIGYWKSRLWVSANKEGNAVRLSLIEGSLFPSCHTHTHNHLTALGQELPSRPVPEETLTHPLTPILIIGHPLSTSSIYILCSVYVLDNPLWQPLSRSSLVFLLVLNPLPHTPCISSPSFLVVTASAKPCVVCVAGSMKWYVVCLSVPFACCCSMWWVCSCGPSG